MENKNARNVLRLLAALVSFPFVAAIFLALLLIVIMMAVIAGVPCLAIWLALVGPCTFVFACARFALENKTDGFECVKDTFIAMADPVKAFREVLIPCASEFWSIVREIKFIANGVNDTLRKRIKHDQEKQM